MDAGIGDRMGMAACNYLYMRVDRHSRLNGLPRPDARLLWTGWEKLRAIERIEWRALADRLELPHTVEAVDLMLCDFLVGIQLAGRGRPTGLCTPGPRRSRHRPGRRPSAAGGGPAPDTDRRGPHRVARHDCRRGHNPDGRRRAQPGRCAGPARSDDRQAPCGRPANDRPRPAEAGRRRAGTRTPGAGFSQAEFTPPAMPCRRRSAVSADRNPDSRRVGGLFGQPAPVALRGRSICDRGPCACPGVAVFCAPAPSGRSSQGSVRPLGWPREPCLPSAGWWKNRPRTAIPETPAARGRPAGAHEGAESGAFGPIAPDQAELDALYFDFRVDFGVP